MSTDPRTPALRDLHPLPRSPEAVSLGCKCTVAQREKSGAPVSYSFTKGCPVPNQR